MVFARASKSCTILKPVAIFTDKRLQEGCCVIPGRQGLIICLIASAETVSVWVTVQACVIKFLFVTAIPWRRRYMEMEERV